MLQENMQYSLNGNIFHTELSNVKILKPYQTDTMFVRLSHKTLNYYFQQ